MPAETRTEAGYPARREYEHPREEKVDVKMWGIFTHLSLVTFIFMGILTFLGPLVVWLVGREKSPAIDAHGKEALNFGITVSMIALVLLILGPVLATAAAAGDLFGLAAVVGTIVVLAWVVLTVFWLVFMILGAVAAGKEKVYHYPVSFRLVK